MKLYELREHHVNQQRIHLRKAELTQAKFHEDAVALIDSMAPVLIGLREPKPPYACEVQVLRVNAIDTAQDAAMKATGHDLDELAVLLSLSVARKAAEADNEFRLRVVDELLDRKHDLVRLT